MAGSMADMPDVPAVTDVADVAAERRRLAVTFALAPLFLGLLPAIVARGGRRLDAALGLRPVGAPPVRVAAGAAVAAAGFGLAFRTIEAQLDRGHGTPLPVMPTSVLLVDGPYRRCRNPMALGAILAYLGIAIAAGTRAGAAIVIGMAAVLLGYIRRVEEPALVERFGEAYLAYRRTTPFLVPRPRRVAGPAARRRAALGVAAGPAQDPATATVARQGGVR